MSHRVIENAPSQLQKHLLNNWAPIETHMDVLEKETSYPILLAETSYVHWLVHAQYCGTFSPRAA